MIRLALLFGCAILLNGCGLGREVAESAVVQAASPASAVESPSMANGAAAASARATRLSPPDPNSPGPNSPDPNSPLAAGSESCPPTGHAAVVDRARQRGWLCSEGVADAQFPITTAVSQPAPGTYKVYAKDRGTTSTFGGHFSYLDNFVAFTYGTNTGARIAFHAVPRDAAGDPYQPYEAVGALSWFGQSSGCIRVLPAQSALIWDHLRPGDAVVVVS